jgi:hypothetical protein
MLQQSRWAFFDLLETLSDSKRSDQEKLESLVMLVHRYLVHVSDRHFGKLDFELRVKAELHAVYECLRMRDEHPSRKIHSLRIGEWETSIRWAGSKLLRDLIEHSPMKKMEREWMVLAGLIPKT